VRGGEYKRDLPRRCREGNIRGIFPSGAGRGTQRRISPQVQGGELKGESLRRRKEGNIRGIFPAGAGRGELPNRIMRTYIK